MKNLVTLLFLLLAGVARAQVYNITYNTGLETPITGSSFTATGGTVNFTLDYAPVTGTTLMVVNNTGLGLIQGTFSNLAQGQVVPLTYQGSIYNFVANYYGGTGNDLVLEWAKNRPVAWGDNQFGELGDNDPNNTNVPALTAVTSSGVLSGKSVVAMSGGYYHSLALCSDGTLAAWGGDENEELGDDLLSYPGSNVPVAVDVSPADGSALAGKTVISMSAGKGFSLALCSDGIVASWGYNGDGELGTGVNNPSSVPAAVDTSQADGSALYHKTVIAVSAGYGHSLALCTDGSVAAWGDNTYGELGNNTMNNSSVPVAVDVLQADGSALYHKTVIAVAAGNGFSLALCSDGTVAAWGTNSDGELGNNDGTFTNSSVSVAVDVAQGDGSALYHKTVVAVAAGSSHTMALCSDGTVAAWGYNGDGELGDNSFTGSNVPVAVDVSMADGSALYNKTVTSVSVGDGFSVALCSDGSVATWGDNTYDELGTSNPAYAVNSTVPVGVDTSSLAAGERVVLAASGSSSIHSLGIVAEPPTPQIVVQQPAGTALTSGSSTVDFGEVSSGGNTSFTFTVNNTGSAPLTISSATVSGAGFTLTTPPSGSVAAGGSTTLVVKFSAASAFTGYGGMLQIASNDPVTSTFNVNLTGIGTGTLTATYNSGSQVPLSVSSFAATGSTVNLTLNYAPVTGTTLMVVNNTGLGLEQGAFSNLAQGQVVRFFYGGIAYDFVANYYGGTGNDLVLQWAHARPVAWGDNQSGELGDNDPSYSNSPTLAAVDTSGVLAGKTVTAMSAGALHSLALCSDGTLAAWGDNGYGELGNNDPTYSGSIVPVAVDVSAQDGSALYGKTVIAVSGGNNFSLALCSDGTVAAWGDNGSGQLGTGGIPYSNVPVAVDVSAADGSALAGKTVVAVCAGYDHSVALCSDGTVVAWGDNGNGELGNNSTIASNVPVAVDVALADGSALSGKQVIALAAGTYFSLTLCSDGTVAAWGFNGDGELGNGDLTFSDSSVPVAVDVLHADGSALYHKTVVAVGAGSTHALALCSDGTRAAWGTDADGELGNNGTTGSAVPVRVTTTGTPLSGKTVIALSAGNEFSLALCSDGTLAAWGDNTYDELGNSNAAYAVSSNVPVAVDTSSLGAGERIVLAASGSSSIHSLGIVAEPPAPQIVVQQPAGTDLTSGTSTVDFGSSSLGAGVTQTFTVVNNGTAPLTLSVPTSSGSNSADFFVTTAPSSSVAVGASTTFAVTFYATVNGAESAALQIASNDPVTNPFVVNLTGTGTGILNATYTTGMEVPLSASGFSATGDTVNFSLNYAPTAGTTLMVVRNTGLPFIQGAFSNLTQGQIVPFSYQGSIYQFVANYYGGPSGRDLVLQWAVAMPVAWGDNQYGELGDGTTNSAPPYGMPLPVAVLAGTHSVLSGKTVIAMAAGGAHSLALCSDGTVAAWGSNSNGQLGNDSTTGSNAPVLVDTTFQDGSALFGKTVIAVAAGDLFSLALCSDGTVVGWGSNSNGQLGNSTTTDSSVPVLVDTSQGDGSALYNEVVIALAAGTDHSLALCSDGTVAAWGGNSFGQLGNADPSNADSTVPVSVSAVAPSALQNEIVTAVAAGSGHSLALCSNGTVASWGSNSNGQLGNNSTTNSNLPVAVSASTVLSGKTVVAVAAGGIHSLGLCLDGTVAVWGANGAGQLGDGTTTDRHAPVAVNTTANVSALSGKMVLMVAAGAGHSLALCSGGALAAWGDDSYGELGNNAATLPQSNVPVAVSTSSLAAGDLFASGSSGSNAMHSLGIAAEPPEPSIDVEQPAGAVLASGGSVNFGATASGGNASLTFTLNNLGTAPLLISSATISGAGFTVTTPPPGSVAAESGTTFVVTFTPPAAFTSYSSVLHIASNDPITSIFNVNLTGIGTGTLNATYTSSSQVPESASAFTATGSTVNFTLGFVPSADTILKVVNDTGPGFIQGAFTDLAQGQFAQLSYGGKTYDFVANYFGGPGNDLVLQWAGPLFSPNYSIITNSVDSGGHHATSAKYSNLGSMGGITGPSSVASPAEVANQGYIAQLTPYSAGNIPRLVVLEQPAGTALTSGGTLAFGAVTSGNISLTLENPGAAPLTIAAGSNLSGVGFTLATSPAGVTLAPGTATTTHCVVGFAPPAAFTSYSGLLQIASNDPVTSSFNLNLTGIATGTLNATYTSASQVPENAGAFTATGSTVNFTLDYTPLAGTILKVVNDTGPGFIQGAFSDLAQGQTEQLSYGGKTYDFVANYFGGPGNDLVLQWAGPLFSANYTIITNSVDACGHRATSAKYSNLGSMGGVAGVSNVASPAEVADQGYIAQLTAALINSVPQIVLQEPAGTALTSGGSTVNFGSSTIGTGVPETFTIRNTGTAVLTFSNPTFGGTNAADFALTTSPGVTTLAAGSGTTFVVTFTPTLAAAETAALHVASNDPATSIFSVNLSGTGLSTLQSWRQQYFGTTANSGNAADTATPKNDGISNLMKFATGMDPTKLGVIPCTLTLSGSNLLFTFPRSKAAVSAGIMFTAQWSDTIMPNSWSNAGVSLFSDVPGVTTDLITDTLPAGSNGRRFVELLVTDPNP